MTASVNLRYVLFMSAAAALGGLLFGFDIAIITGAGLFLTQHFGLDDRSLGVAYSALLWGCVVGAAFAGLVTDRFGRRRVLLVVALLFAVTSAATALAPSFSAFLAARFVGGLAVGAVSLAAPMYISEVAPPALRGRLGALYQMAIVTGIVVSYVINYLLSDNGPDNWRWMFMTGVIPSVLFLALLWFAPETPRYLVMAGRKDEARQVAERIAGPAVAEQELREISHSLAAGRHGFTHLLRPGILRPVLVGLGLSVLIHFSGINTVIDYAPKIFQSAGFEINGALLSTFGVGLTNFLFTIVSFWTIDRFGRRPLYILGSLGMAATLGLMTWTAANGHFQGLLVLVLIIVYIICFCSCIGPVFWTLLPEMYPNHVRSTALIVPVVGQWIANAVVVQFFPVIFSRLGQAGTFGLLAAFSLAQALFTWWLVPETKNRALEDIEQSWRTGVV